MSHPVSFQGIIEKADLGNPLVPCAFMAHGLGVKRGGKLDFPGRKILDFAKFPALEQDFRIYLKIVRGENHFPHCSPHDHASMSPHQGSPPVPQAAGERVAHLIARDEKTSVSKLVPNIPDGHLVADDRRDVDDRMHGGFGHGKWKEPARVVMAYRHNIRARLVDTPMDWTLPVNRKPSLVDGRAVESKLKNVFLQDLRPRLRSRHQVTPGVVGVPHRNVAERIQYPLEGQDPVGNHEIWNYVHHALFPRSDSPSAQKMNCAQVAA